MAMYRMRAHREHHALWPDPKEPRLRDERHRPPLRAEKLQNKGEFVEPSILT